MDHRNCRTIDNYFNFPCKDTYRNLDREPQQCCCRFSSFSGTLHHTFSFTDKKGTIYNF